ncbi:NADP-dependent mannitol dehydrogenase [Hysterangium stoloniferum]|nr:NADP-dependent mannitol dehydrogenase [Hysterangium stoloniferum]
MPFTLDYTNKNFVVTGGNRGIGLAISRALVNAGGNVAIIYRTSKDAPSVAEKLAKEFGVTVKAYQADVSDLKRVREIFSQIDQDFGTIHGVVANAGVAIVKPALEIEGREEFDFMYDTNVLGVFNAAQTAAKSWIAKGFKEGSIVVVSSMSSQIYNQSGLCQPLTHVFYNSSKAAVSSLAKALAAEWAHHSIRVNIVSPGYVATEQSGVHPPEVRKFQAASVPLGRYSEPREHTAQVLLLLSPEFSSYTTGSEVFIDGGFLIY